MTPLKVIVVFSVGFLCALTPFANGITVRFLANPPEDSIARYAVLRSEGAGKASVEVGEVAALPGRDTLSFADSAAVRGRAYIYSVVGIDAAGGRSQPSESTHVALPALNLPDTLRADTAGFKWRLPLEGDPLCGISPLALSALDTARFALAYDQASRDLAVTARSGAVSGWLVVRAVYFGKFESRDSLWVALPAAKPAALSGAAAASADDAIAVPAVWSQARGSLSLRGGSGVSELLILDVRGAIVAEVSLPGNGSEVLWEGRDRHGRALAPANYLWSARAKRGKQHRTGRLRIIP